jgi:hypothetical protein
LVQRRNHPVAERGAGNPEKKPREEDRSQHQRKHDASSLAFADPRRRRLDERPGILRSPPSTGIAARLTMSKRIILLTLAAILSPGAAATARISAIEIPILAIILGYC